ncbi:ELMO/CED-12 family-domain-containing protein [Halteromyces radiatus]|uniref:ELMO/CED-12 family-domain-containing protein n=1 Tax=Halteromyces radiatus TaxID=101107 RepID=UPI00221FB7DB|nr:ELMO/CED-12 family-domain-containing protein [Halteromyces radiatus]KAI8099735.1 ELMO/CED-12 family-domain-containing protein [Halteromyces radiatus]
MKMEWYIFLLFNKIYQSPFLLSIYKIYKCLLRWTTNTTEIYRICHRVVNDHRDNLLQQQHTFTISDSECDNYSDSNNSDEKIGEFNDNTPLLKHSEKSTLPFVIPPTIVFQIDRSILYSSQLTLERRQLESKDCLIDDLTQSILTKKRFPGTLSSPEAQVLKACLVQIAATYQLTREINERAHTKFDGTNQLHEQKLLKLWNSLMPDVELEARLTRQWGEIGFQGNDPASDFRGMGMQGLDDLVYYSKTYPTSCQRTFHSSQHPVSWYPFAIVGINISQFTIQILRTRQLQYVLFRYGISRDTYQDFYCFLYHTFNDYWNSHEDPRLTVMEFEETFKKFKRMIHGKITTQEVVPLGEYLKQQQEETWDQEENGLKTSSLFDNQKTSSSNSNSHLHHRIPHSRS